MHKSLVACSQYVTISTTIWLQNTRIISSSVYELRKSWRMSVIATSPSLCALTTLVIVIDSKCTIGDVVLVLLTYNRCSLLSASIPPLIFLDLFLVNSMNVPNAQLLSCSDSSPNSFVWKVSIRQNFSRFFITNSIPLSPNNFIPFLELCYYKNKAFSIAKTSVSA